MMVGRRFIAGTPVARRRVRPAQRALRRTCCALSWGFYDRHQTGQLMSRATVDLQARPLLPRLRPHLLRPAHPHRRRRRPRSSSSTTGRSRSSRSRSRPSSSRSPTSYSRASHPILKDVQQRLADMTTVAEENIVGVNVVKAFAQEPREEQKFAGRTEAVFDAVDRGDAAARVLRAGALVPAARSRRPRCCSSAAARSIERRASQLGALRRVQHLRPHADHAAADARHVDRHVPARRRLGRADLRGPRRAARRSPSGPTPYRSPRAAAARFERVTFGYDPERPGAPRHRRSSSRRAGRWR